MKKKARFEELMNQIQRKKKTPYPKEEEDTIWKLRSEKRRFEEETQRFGVENAERFELENIDQKNAKRSKYRFGVENARLKNRGTRVL